jgi:hypothetical protein
MNGFNNIGIDGKLDWERIAKLLRIGLFASIMVFIGDWILGYGVENENLTGMERMLSAFVGRTDTELFWASFLGAVGISLEGLCYFGIYRLMAEQSLKHAHLYRTGILGYLIFGPCGVHVSCVVVAYIYDNLLKVAPTEAFAVAMRFAKLFMMPTACLFTLFFIILSISQISAFVKELTPYPKWCWIFSLPVGMVVAMLFKVFGNHAFVNAMLTAWISVGNIWMFGGLLLMMNKAKEKSNKGM